MWKMPIIGLLAFTALASLGGTVQAQTVGKVCAAKTMGLHDNAKTVLIVFFSGGKARVYVRYGLDNYDRLVKGEKFSTVVTNMERLAEIPAGQNIAFTSKYGVDYSIEVSPSGEVSGKTESHKASGWGDTITGKCLPPASG